MRCSLESCHNWILGGVPRTENIKAGSRSVDARTRKIGHASGSPRTLRGMKFSLATLFAFLLALSLVACGDSSTTAEKSKREESTSQIGKEDNAKATVVQLIALAKSGDAKAAAPLVIYRGKDKKRKWKDVCIPANPDELERVGRLLERIKGLVGDEAPTFDSFETETEPEGEWLVWKTKIGKREVMFACLDINGQVALGDIDT